MTLERVIGQLMAREQRELFATIARNIGADAGTVARSGNPAAPPVAGGAVGAGQIFDADTSQPVPDAAPSHAPSPHGPPGTALASRSLLGLRPPLAQPAAAGTPRFGDASQSGQPSPALDRDVATLPRGSADAAARAGLAPHPGSMQPATTTDGRAVPVPAEPGSTEGSTAETPWRAGHPASAPPTGRGAGTGMPPAAQLDGTGAGVDPSADPAAGTAGPDSGVAGSAAATGTGGPAFSSLERTGAAAPETDGGRGARSAEAGDGIGTERPGLGSADVAQPDLRQRGVERLGLERHADLVFGQNAAGAPALAERAGVIASFVLNAAMIPGWPPPRPLEGARSDIAAALRQLRQATTEAEAGEALARMGMARDYLARIAARLAALRRRVRLLFGLVVLLNSTRSVLAALAADEPPDMEEQLASALSRRLQW